MVGSFRLVEVAVLLEEAFSCLPVGVVARLVEEAGLQVEGVASHQEVEADCQVEVEDRPVVGASFLQEEAADCFKVEATFHLEAAEDFLEGPYHLGVEAAACRLEGEEGYQGVVASILEEVVSFLEVASYWEVTSYWAAAC